MLTTMERDKQIHLEEMKMFKEELRKVKHQLTVANDKVDVSVISSSATSSHK